MVQWASGMVLLKAGRTRRSSNLRPGMSKAHTLNIPLLSKRLPVQPLDRFAGFLNHVTRITDQDGDKREAVLPDRANLTPSKDRIRDSIMAYNGSRSRPFPKTQEGCRRDLRSPEERVLPVLRD